jgi:uncharacterized protein (DUF1015 family)
MARIRPFAALLPDPERAARICELPYDVMSSEEARRMAEGNPLSFLRVSKPEIELAPDTDPCSPAVYARGRENFQRLIAQGALRRDLRPCFYLYRQVMNRHSQVGIVAAASCEEYLEGIIKKHELTRPDKEDDRVRHIQALDAQTGPVFLTYRADSNVDEFVRGEITGEPHTDFVAPDGVRHTSWRVADAEKLDFMEQAVARVPCLYIADGHHRSAAAARVFKERNGRDASAGFLAVIFPHDQMQILPYHRVLADLNGLSPKGLLERLEAVFETRPDGNPSPRHANRVSLYLDGRWYDMAFRPELTASRDAIGRLDVTLLQDHVLGPVLGIDDPRTSRRMHFVGGIRGTPALEKLVNGGQYACAFSMFPTSIEDLMSVADAGGIMPPKSTWFEPKLRDAMFCLMLDGSAGSSAPTPPAMAAR